MVADKGDQKKGGIQPENFCVCAPENGPLQGGAESWHFVIPVELCNNTCRTF